MTERIHESLSALMDDEADDLELARVLKALDDDAPDSDDVRARWSRYHLVSAVLRGTTVDADAARPVDIAALHAEAPESGAPPADAPLASVPLTASATVHDVEEPSAPVRRRMLGNWGGFAVAASLTLAVVVLLRGPDGSAPVDTVADSGIVGGAVSDLASGNVVQATVGGAARTLEARAPEVREPRGAAPVVDHRVDAYMLRHAEFNAMDSRAGVVSFTRYAAFEGSERR